MPYGNFPQPQGNALIEGAEPSPLTVGANLILSQTGLTAARTFTFPDLTDTVVTLTATQTLTSKTLTAPVISGTASGGTYSGTASGTISGNIATATGMTSSQVTTALAYTPANRAGDALSGTFSGTPTLSGTIAFTATSPFSIANGQTLTLSVTSQTVGAATLTIPNFANVSDTFAFITLAQTLSNKTIAAPVLSGTTTGTYTLGGTPTISATTAFTATSPFTIANSQTLTVSVASQTVGAATLTIPNFANVSDTFTFNTLAATLTNKTMGSSTVFSVAPLHNNNIALNWNDSGSTARNVLNLNASNVLLLTNDAAGAMNLQTDNASGAGNLVTRISIPNGQAQGSGPINSAEALIFNTVAAAIGTNSGIGSSAANGDLLLNSVSGQTTRLRIAGTDVMTVAGALITLAQPMSAGAQNIYNVNSLVLSTNSGDVSTGNVIGSRTGNLTVASNADGSTARAVVIDTPNVVTAGIGHESVRMTFNAGQATGSSGISSNETIYFGGNATGFAYSAQAAITADLSAGNLIANAPTGKSVLGQINGTTVLTIAGASVTNAQKWINTAIADPSAAAGQFWLSSTNVDVLKYSNGSTIYDILSTKGSTGTFTSAAPAGTTSATAVMMAAGAATVTPTTSTRVLITASGQMANSLLNDGGTVDLRISAVGNQTAPVNGAAVSGTLLGRSQTATSLVAADKHGFSIAAVATGLTIGQAFWIDLSLLAITAGTATVTDVTITVTEI